MVAISAAIISKSGRVLLARQFLPIAKPKIEGYLNSFPKLLSPDPTFIQNTFIETDSIRYVFLPLESLYVVLITVKNSNILEDLDTLSLFAKVVTEMCGANLNQREEEVMSHSFDIIFAWDEIVSPMGYKEFVNISQIKTYVEMDSHEEKLQKIILENKMNSARSEMQRKAESIEKQKNDMKKQLQLGGPGNAFGSESAGYGSRAGGSSYGGYNGQGAAEDDTQSYSQRPSSKSPTNFASKASTPKESGAAAPKKGPGGGMQLSKSAKSGDAFFTQLNREEKIVTTNLSAFHAAGTSSSSSLAPSENVKIIVEEKFVAELDRENTLLKYEVKGEIKCCIFDPDVSKVFIETSHDLSSAGFRANLHPKMNKSLFASDSVLTLTDASKGFPVGSQNAVSIIKWKKSQGSEEDLPISINFWPNVENGHSVVSVEFTADNLNGMELHNVMVRFPCPSSEPPDVHNIDGEHRFEQRQKLFVWRIGDVSSDRTSGSLEFSIPEVDADSFFPISIDFTSDQLLSRMQVNDVKGVETQQSVKYTAEQSLSVEKFVVQ